MSEPTLGEVLRRLDEVANTLTNLASRLDKDYVRKDVYGEWREAMAQRVKDIEAELDEKVRDATAFRRQIIVCLVGVGVPAVLAMVLAINNFLAAGGATP